MYMKCITPLPESFKNDRVYGNIAEQAFRSVFKPYINFKMKRKTIRKQHATIYASNATFMFHILEIYSLKLYTWKLLTV